MMWLIRRRRRQAVTIFGGKFVAGQLRGVVGASWICCKRVFFVVSILRLCEIRAFFFLRVNY